MYDISVLRKDNIICFIDDPLPEHINSSIYKKERSPRSFFSFIVVKYEVFFFHNL